MKMNFSKKEYRLLLDLIYLGYWMIQAHETKPSDENEKYEMLTQKIYSVAKEMGCGDLVESSKRLNEYCTTRAYEEESGIHDVINQYNVDTFWDELVDRLAERDARIDAKAANIEIKSAEQYWELSIPHESKYAEEFEKNGLSNLYIRET